MLFSLAQRLTDALLLCDMAVEFFDVTARLLRLRGGVFDILHVGAIGEVDDGDNRNRGGESKEADVANDARDDSDRKSTRLNSSHGYISYAVFCLKKKKKH